MARSCTRRCSAAKRWRSPRIRRLPYPRNRDLNYSIFVDTGDQQISECEDFNSHNTRRLDRAEVVATLERLDYIKQVRANPAATVEGD